MKSGKPGCWTKLLSEDFCFHHLRSGWDDNMWKEHNLDKSGQVYRQVLPCVRVPSGIIGSVWKDNSRVLKLHLDLVQRSNYNPARYEDKICTTKYATKVSPRKWGFPFEFGKLWWLIVVVKRGQRRRDGPQFQLHTRPNLFFLFEYLSPFRYFETLCISAGALKTKQM